MEWELKIEDGLRNKIVYVQDVDADEMVGECYEGEVEDRIARARLIAAAPEMLSMLKYLYHSSINMQIRDSIRVLYHKATGEHLS